jgi:hypothetical protein
LSIDERSQQKSELAHFEQKKEKEKELKQELKREEK